MFTPKKGAWTDYLEEHIAIIISAIIMAAGATTLLGIIASIS